MHSSMVHQSRFLSFITRIITLLKQRNLFVQFTDQKEQRQQQCKLAQVSILIILVGEKLHRIVRIHREIILASIFTID